MKQTFWSGLFWGAVIGGAIGLLNAPRKGSETRTQLKEFKEQTQSDVTDLKIKVDHLNTVVDQVKNDGVQTTQALVEELQGDIKHFMENNQPRINRIQRRIETLKDNLEENMNNLSNVSEN